MNGNAFNRLATDDSLRFRAYTRGTLAYTFVDNRQQPDDLIAPSSSEFRACHLPFATASNGPRVPPHVSFFLLIQNQNEKRVARRLKTNATYYEHQRNDRVSYVPCTCFVHRVVSCCVSCRQNCDAVCDPDDVFLVFRLLARSLARSSLHALFAQSLSRLTRRACVHLGRMRGRKKKQNEL